MDTRFARISNRSEDPMKPECAQVLMKGGKGLCSLAEGINLPKSDDGKLVSKIQRVVVESYMKRPSLKADAIKGIYKFVNNSILTVQNPNYPCAASVSTVFIRKNKYVYACAGYNVIFHFVDGKLADAFTCDEDDDSVCLGALKHEAPLVSQEYTFQKNDHAFLICTRKFADDLSREILEDTLRRATHMKTVRNHTVKEVQCDLWLKMLRDAADGFDSQDDYSAVAMHIPNRRKKPKWVLALIAVILALAVFFGFGAMKRNANAPDMGSGQSQQGMMPGQEQQGMMPGQEQQSGQMPPQGPFSFLRPQQPGMQPGQGQQQRPARPSIFGS